MTDEPSPTEGVLHTSIQTYATDGFYDEMFEAPGRSRSAYQPLLNRLKKTPDEDVLRRQRAAERSFLQSGITFNVYGDAQGTERIWPFDIVPRIISQSEWNTVEQGLKQRTHALNHFINDIYHNQQIIKDGSVPDTIIDSAKSLRPQCVGSQPPRGIWAHIIGTDLIRDNDGQLYVLEDNLRCPSGVSYVLQNRQVMKQTFPYLFETCAIRPVDDYPHVLLNALQYLMSDQVSEPSVAVLTPGVFNSAYFEHSFLAQQMGVPLVEGRDLIVDDGFVYMRTVRGFRRLDVLYRRIDDDFLDPEAFNPDSVLGVPGLMDAYMRGRIALANAPGTGIADDKVVYAYVPQMIKYYLGEDPILPNVPTYLCSDKAQRQHVLENLDKLVVKAANESGGYGMLIGPKSTVEQRETFAQLIKDNPRNYIGQPTLKLSRVPVIQDGRLEGRHVDLRPFIISGEEIYVLPGGLTRVALVKGSLVVNSSQGGGSKDTWVVDDTMAGDMMTPSQNAGVEVNP